MMSAERGAAANTLDAYRRDLGDYGGYLRARGAALERARPEDVSAYAASLEAAGLKGTTIQRRLSAVRQFHRFLFAEQLSSDNPATNASAAKPAAALPTVMNEAEVLRLLAQARAEAETAGRERHLRAQRLLCLVELLYATGLRVSELVGLKTSAVEKGRDLLLVRGKGGRERMVPISPRARTALQLWLKAKHDPRRALANYRSALALGGTRPLPELFAAAGIEFDFSERTLRPLMQAIERELADLGGFDSPAVCGKW